MGNPCIPKNAPGGTSHLQEPSAHGFAPTELFQGIFGLGKSSSVCSGDWRGFPQMLPKCSFRAHPALSASLGGFPREMWKWDPAQGVGKGGKSERVTKKGREDESGIFQEDLLSSRGGKRGWKTTAKGGDSMSRDRQDSKSLTQPRVLHWEHHSQTLLGIQDFPEPPVCDIPGFHPLGSGVKNPISSQFPSRGGILAPTAAPIPKLSQKIRKIPGVFWDRDVPPALVPDVLHSPG